VLKIILQKRLSVTWIFQSRKVQVMTIIWPVLGRCLNQIDRSNFSPDFVLYDAAIDVHSNDKLGLLEMTSEGIFERDKVVLSHFKKKQVPIATTIGGGYGEAHQEVAQRHGIIFQAVKSVFVD
jgi:acetoin utilization deacetylase AcuC-like enzyme